MGSSVGSPRFAVTKQELGQIFWVSLLFGLAAFVTKFVALGGDLNWGSYSEVWTVAAAGLAWLVKRFLTDTRPNPPLPIPPIFRGKVKN